MHTSTATKRSIRSTIAALLAVLTMLAMVVPAAAAAKDVYSSEPLRLSITARIDSMHMPALTVRHWSMEVSAFSQAE